MSATGNLGLPRRQAKNTLNLPGNMPQDRPWMAPLVLTGNPDRLLCKGLVSHHHVRHRRLARTVRLLAEPRRPVAVIAVAAGFSLASHLARHVRQATGMSPDMFRDSLLSRL